MNKSHYSCIFRRWKRFLLGFDKLFSSNKALRPIIYVFVLCFILAFISWLISLSFQQTPASNVRGSISPAGRAIEIIQLILDPGTYPSSTSMPYIFQLLIVFVGIFCIPVFLISICSNSLTNRAASHRKGFLRYYFSNHILILGGSKMVVGLLKSIAADKKQKTKEVVILTNTDAEALWTYVTALLSEEEQKLSLIIYNGERNMEKTLTSCQVELASEIYIIGEDDEDEHDSTNVDCWNIVKQLREEKAQSLSQCYLSLERNASTHLFNFLSEEMDNPSMETTIVNRLESIAQKILIGDDNLWKEHTLDRSAINKDSDKYVHLVIDGMTPMGYALATTAAHLCHYPNFNEKAEQPIRTKITLIDENADQEMKFFMGRYPCLFDLSHSTYRDGGKNESMQPKPEYGDFLDVEWEFFKGTMMDSWVQDELKNWMDDERQILTVAFCGTYPEQNIAHALYLPHKIYRHTSIPDQLTIRDPQIFVYQPNNSAIAKTAQQVGFYRNIFPFGVITDSFDIRLSKRITAAKRIHYLYDLEKHNKKYEAMADNAELDKLWRELSYAEKMSNIYAANSIYCKLRSMNIDCNNPNVSFDGPLIGQLASMEHARWNIEKLLVGFQPLPKSKREALREQGEQAEVEIKKLKRNEFKHNDIAPYNELTPKTQAFDKAIVKNIMDVIK